LFRYINLTYNADTKRAGFNVTFTEDTAYNKIWNISTPDAATDLLLYNVLPMASLDSVTASISGDELTANWSGTELGKFETMSFMAVKNPEDTDGTLIYRISDSAKISSGSVAFKLSDTLKSGSYYVKATAVKDAELCETEVTTGSFDFTNANQPAPPSSVAAVNGGDCKIDAEVSGPEGTYDGYLINIYEKQNDGSWILNEAGGIEYEKDNEIMSVGGRYSYTYELTTVTKGIEPGKIYRLGVASYRKNSDDPDDIRVFYSTEIFSNEITLSEPDPANVAFAAQGATAVKYSSGEAETVMIDTFKTEDIKFMMVSDQSVSGSWSLDSLSGTIMNSKSTEIALMGLEDGNHTLTFIGKNNAGDGVIVQKRFAVDTLPPRLLLEAPVNGGLFEVDGKLKLKGISDAGTRIKVKGTEFLPIVNLDGSFVVTAQLDATMATQDVTISAVDKVGNEVSHSMRVTNKALGQINSLKLYADGVEVTNKSLTGGHDSASSLTRNLVLKARVSNGVVSEIVLNDSSLVSWSTMAVAGSSSVGEYGNLSLGAGARGIVTGKLAVSEEGGLTAAAVFGAQAYADSKEPQKPHTGKTKFTEAESAFDKFIDVKGHWAEKYMRSMFERGLFMGVDEVGFAPENPMTRGMFITVMGRLEKADTNSTIDKFLDVSKTMYYAPYIAWAIKHDIVNGIEENMFMPEGFITREQLATILYRYEEYKKYDLSTGETVNLQSYKDYTEISEYAVSAMKWCVESGIIQGSSDGGLHPGYIATRAEVSAMMLRFIEKYVE